MARKERLQDPNRLGFGRLLAFKSSDISAAWINLIMLNYLSIFASDVLGVSIGVVGTLLLVSKIVDAVTDLIAGWLVDNTHSKLGKGRPYELAIIGMTVTSVFLFIAKPEWGNTAKYIWIFFMYTLCFSIFATLRTAGMNPYTLRAFSNNPVVLKKVASYGGIITMAGSIVMSVLFPRLLANLAIGEGLTAADYPSQAAWFRLVAIIMTGATAIALLRFFLIKEDPSIEANDKHDKVNFKEILTLFAKNKYTWIYGIIMLAYNISTNLAVGSYYFKYVVGDVAAQGLLSVFGIVLLPLMLLFPAIMKKIGSMSKMIVYFCVIGIVGYILVFFANANLPMIYAGYVLGTLATLPIAYYGILFVMNICNYNEMIGLPRMDGSSGILGNFSAKLGGAVGSFITGILLSIAGYVSEAGVTTQPASAIMMIRVDFAIVPAILLGVILVCCLAFNKMELKVTAWEAEKKAAQAENA